MAQLQQTPLHSRHLAAGAKMADFGGWSMPIEYESVVAEHNAVRQSVGIFDVSHMGKVRVHGAGALDGLNAVLANDLNRIGDGQAQYSLLCKEQGGVIDDLIVYRWRADELFIIPNAANAQRVVATLRGALPETVTIDDMHHSHGIIAVQGPRSAAVVGDLGLPHDHDYMAMVASSFAGEPVVVCRTGYTGEHGYELVLPNATLGQAWDALMARSAQFDLRAAGLGARDTLRTEMGYPLHGQDISEQITPVQAGLGWAVGWDKPNFAGRAVLLQERGDGPRRRLRGLRSLDRGIPRAHMHVYGADDEAMTGPAIGEVTSGTFSPSLRQGIGLALLDPSIDLGAQVVVDVRGRASMFEVVKPPFVQPSTREP
ncbi:MAG: glycine cleavage system aminomethyltransferase GcvT [Actinomycetales bacterium]